jgi:hypothetical protein
MSKGSETRPCVSVSVKLPSTTNTQDGSELPLFVASSDIRLIRVEYDFLVSQILLQANIAPEFDEIVKFVKRFATLADFQELLLHVLKGRDKANLEITREGGLQSLVQISQNFFSLRVKVKILKLEAQKLGLQFDAWWDVAIGYRDEVL